MTHFGFQMEQFLRLRSTNLAEKAKNDRRDVGRPWSCNASKLRLFYSVVFVMFCCCCCAVSKKTTPILTACVIVLTYEARVCDIIIIIIIKCIYIAQNRVMQLTRLNSYRTSIRIYPNCRLRYTWERANSRAIFQPGALLVTTGDFYYISYIQRLWEFYSPNRHGRQQLAETIITAQTKNAQSSLQIQIRAWPIIHSIKRSQSTLDNTSRFQ